jgi:hypothetical protein
MKSSDCFSKKRKLQLASPKRIKVNARQHTAHKHGRLAKHGVMDSTFRVANRKPEGDINMQVHHMLETRPRRAEITLYRTKILTVKKSGSYSELMVVKALSRMSKSNGS